MSKKHPPAFQTGAFAVNKTLSERGERYGPFSEDAAVAMALKRVVRNSPSYGRMAAHHQHALDEICLKISRICCGDPNHTDSWHDIQGYAKLVEDIINGDER